MSVYICDGKAYVSEKKLTIYAKDGKLFAKDEEWITINGAHIKVGENGEVQAGAGGKFNGMKIEKFKGRPKQWGGHIVRVKKKTPESVKEFEKKEREAFEKNQKSFTGRLFSGTRSELEKGIQKEKKKMEGAKETLKNFRNKQSKAE